ncbi:hypothetical protein V5O48_016802 [Marasmius crinis-equi]|uniref:DUF6699 domain-containing protein n=1 Tax=Marasmius crinis-equi TaxID=585013 RepID=A0ABR3EQP4_9AGAR
MSDTTPFIPPLGTPASGRSSRNLPPHHTPLPGNLPFSPRTDANTGYIPGEPATQPGGLSSDYTGYPTDLPPTPSSNSHSPYHSSHSHPNTPGTRPAEMQHGAWPGYGMGTPYHAPPPMPPYYGPPHPPYGHSPFVPPMTMGTPYGPPPMGMGTPYGPPPMSMGMGTPYQPPGAWPLPPTHGGGGGGGGGHTPYSREPPLPPHGPPPPLQHSHSHGPPPQGPPQIPQAWMHMYGGYPGPGGGMYGPPPGGPGGPYDMSGMAGALGGMGGMPGGLGRAAEPGIDRIDQWAAGAHYGPVLEPFLTHILNTKLLINPLLSPSTPESDLPFLKWNMLFPSSMCQRSGDAEHVSWNRGRNEPATFPRITKLTLIPSVSTASLRNAATSMHQHQTGGGGMGVPAAFLAGAEQTALPFLIDINASKPDVGVTCGDVIDGIYVAMYQMQGGTEFKALPEKGDLRRVAGYAYRHNRSRTHGVPGGALGEGLRRLDWMGLDIHFGGIRAPGSTPGHAGAEHTIRRVCGFGSGGTFNNSTDENDRLPEDDLAGDNPCTFELLCVRRRPMTREEAERDQRDVERAQAELAGAGAGAGGGLGAGGGGGGGERRPGASRRMSRVSSQGGDGSSLLERPSAMTSRASSRSSGGVPAVMVQSASESSD